MRATALTIVVIGGLVATGALTDVRLPTPPARPDPAVALPDADAVPQGRGLQGEERESALAPFDPERARCEPAGCDLWRRPHDRWSGHGSSAAGTLVLPQGAEIVGIDVETGQDEWRREVAEEVRRGRGWGPGSVPVVTGNATTVAVASSTGLQLLTRDGEPLWAVAHGLEAVEVWWVDLTDEAVILLYALPFDLAASDTDDHTTEDEAIEDRSQEEVVDELGHGVAVFDRLTGELRWSRAGVDRLQPLGDGSPPVLTMRDGDEVVVLDLATGRPRFALGTAHPGPSIAVDLGTFIAATHVVDETEVLQLIDPADGTVRAEVPGTVHTIRSLADAIIVVRQLGGGDRSGTLEAVALDERGAIRWQRDLGPTAAGACCSTILDLGDGRVRLAAGPAAEATVVDLTSGAIDEDDPLGNDPLDGAPDDGAVIETQFGAQILVQGFDDGGFTLRHVEGGVLTVQGQAWPLAFSGRGMGGPVAHPLDEPIVLQSSRELIGVRFR